MIAPVLAVVIAALSTIGLLLASWRKSGLRAVVAPSPIGRAQPLEVDLIELVRSRIRVAWLVGGAVAIVVFAVIGWREAASTGASHPLRPEAWSSGLPSLFGAWQAVTPLAAVAAALGSLLARPLTRGADADITTADLEPRRPEPGIKAWRTVLAGTSFAALGVGVTAALSARWDASSSSHVITAVRGGTENETTLFGWPLVVAVVLGLVTCAGLGWIVLVRAAEAPLGSPAVATDQGAWRRAVSRFAALLGLAAASLTLGILDWAVGSANLAVSSFPISRHCVSDSSTISHCGLIVEKLQPLFGIGAFEIALGILTIGVGVSLLILASRTGRMSAHVAASSS